MKTTAKQNYGISTIVSRFVVMAALVMATNNVYAQSQNNKPATKCDTLCHTKQKLCTDSIRRIVRLRINSNDTTQRTKPLTISSDFHKFKKPDPYKEKFNKMNISETIRTIVTR